jgi:hypothetical protein
MSAKEKQHFETALSHAIELTQQSSPGCSSQDSEDVQILERKRSQIKQQVQNELSLRDRALLSHASIVQSLYDEARARLKSIPVDFLLHLPNIFVSDIFEQDRKAIIKAGEQLALVKHSPVAMLAEVSRIAPSFAVQDAVFVAMHHAMDLASDEPNYPYFLIHFNKIKWLFEKFSVSEGRGSAPVMSKSKFIECTTRICCSDAPENKLVQLYDALNDTGEMAFHHFCCAFLHSEPQQHINEVHSISFFRGDDHLLHLGGSVQDSTARESIKTSDAQVVPSSLTNECSCVSCAI